MMKKYIAISLIFLGFTVTAQEKTITEKASVEKNLFGAQLGLLNTNFYYETKLDRKITLRTELGLEWLFSTKQFDDPAIKDKKASVISPFVLLEPRWYYGLDRRKRLNKNIQHNSSNYFSLKTSYSFTNAPLIHSGDFEIVPALLVIPKFGIRRAFAKNFNYEFSGGVGLQYNVFNNGKCDCNHNSTAIDLQIKIGYDF